MELEPYKLHEETYFQWVQVISAIPRLWKDVIKQNTNNADNLLTHNHHIVSRSRILIAEKLTCKELYSYLISTIKVEPSPNTYFENLFKENELT